MPLVSTPAVVTAATRLADVADKFGASPTIGTLPRPLPTELKPIEHALANGRYQSPLRYPGAKSALAPVIARVITSARRSREVGNVDLLVEPFAGGASTSLRLVGSGVVDRILLADADPLVAAFWQTAAEDTERLIDRAHDEWDRFVRPGGRSGVQRWDYWRAWEPRWNTQPRTRRLGAAMKCLFLNRTTFSGILHGTAGPLGGRLQQSPYTIGCRWNPEGIAERIRLVGHLYDSGRLVDVWRKDWQQTLVDVPEYYPQLLPSRVLAYLDPPYVEKSSALYRASFDPTYNYHGTRRARASKDDSLHLMLANHLTRKAQFRWVLSYDNHPMLTENRWLYANSRMTPSAADRTLLGISQWTISKRLVRMRYSAAGRIGKRSTDELLLTTLPPASVPIDDQLRIV